MVYNKEKILKIINFKDTIKDNETRTALEWLIKQYNNYFVDSKEIDQKRNENKNILLKYYDAEDEKKELRSKLKRIKKSYFILKEKNTQLQKELKQVAKKKKK